MITAKVRFGPFAGFTMAEMETEWARYKAELSKGGSRLIGASVAGQTYQFGPRGDWSLAEWGKQVRHALSQVSPDFLAPQATIFTRFGGC